jgi:hypothetical protein
LLNVKLLVHHVASRYVLTCVIHGVVSLRALEPFRTAEIYTKVTVFQLIDSLKIAQISHTHEAGINARNKSHINARIRSLCLIRIYVHHQLHYKITIYHEL